MSSPSHVDRIHRDTVHLDSCGTPLETGSGTPATVCLSHLQALGVAVQAISDFRVSLVHLRTSSALALHITNPHAACLSEDITCDFRDDAWWFMWSWNKPVGPATAPAGAAQAIRHVLSPGCDPL